MSQLLIAAIAFAFFIPCPRMAGMANVIANASKVNLIKESNRVGPVPIDRREYDRG